MLAVGLRSWICIFMKCVQLLPAASPREGSPFPRKWSLDALHSPSQLWFCRESPGGTVSSSPCTEVGLRPGGLHLWENGVSFVIWRASICRIKPSTDSRTRGQSPGDLIWASSGSRLLPLQQTVVHSKPMLKFCSAFVLIRWHVCGITPYQWMSVASSLILSLSLCE